MFALARGLAFSYFFLFLGRGEKEREARDFSFLSFLFLFSFPRSSLIIRSIVPRQHAKSRFNRVQTGLRVVAAAAVSVGATEF